MNTFKFDESVLANTHTLLMSSEKLFPHIADALFAHVLATVVLAKGVEMSLERLQEGVAAAYRDIATVANGGSDVH